MDSKMIAITKTAACGPTEYALRTIPFAYRMKEREDLPPWFGPLGEMETAITKWTKKHTVLAILRSAIKSGRYAMDLLALTMASVGRQCERAAIAAEEMRIALLTLRGPLGRNELGIQDGLRRILDANGPYLTFLDLAFGYSFVEITPEMCEYPGFVSVDMAASSLRKTLIELGYAGDATGTEDTK